MSNVAEPVQNLQSSQSYSSLNGLNLILPKRSAFKFASLNITSLMKHIDELSMKLDLMVLLVTTKYIYMVTKLFVVTENSTIDLVVVFAFIFVMPYILKQIL